MKALILNSGTGSRMGDITKKRPKCMTKITPEDTILSRQLKLLSQSGITKALITTGFFHDEIKNHCESLGLPIEYEFVRNDKYSQTNYIYSIFLARELLKDDIILMHGDLVFDLDVLQDALNHQESCMATSSTLPLPQKDFKAVINNNKITAVGIEFFENAQAAQPLYKLNKEDWLIWLDSIISFCENGNTSVYAENAFNKVSDKCLIFPFDYKNKLCNEIDTLEDLNIIKNILGKKGK